MLAIGDHMPEFQLLNQEGEKITAADFAGRKAVIFFYPKAATPTCTTEVCNLRDHFTELKEAGYYVIGVSADPVQAQKKFHTTHKLPFDLLADVNWDLTKKFGVWQERKTFGKTYMGIVRSTFVFDENGRCTKVIGKVRSKEAAAQILHG